MIIDAREHHQTGRRSYTVLGAVAYVLDGMEPGSSVDVEKLLDATGEARPLAQLHAAVGKARGDRVFAVRKHPGVLARVYRLR